MKRERILPIIETPVTRRPPAAPRRGLPAVSGCGGFTLIELLMVLLIMGVLLGLISGGILYAVQNARRNRNRTTILTLRTALQTYRHEYGDWPYAPEDARMLNYADFPYHDSDRTPSTYHGVQFSRLPQPINDNQNFRVFNRLLRDHPRNTKRITFLEPGRFLAVDGDGERRRWADCLSGGGTASCALIDPWGQPYRVTINLDEDTVDIK